MTRNDALSAVAMACHGGADIDLIKRRTADLAERDRHEALRDLIAAGTIHRATGAFRVRDNVERYCARCGQKLPHAERGRVHGMTIICTICERNKK